MKRATLRILIWMVIWAVGAGVGWAQTSSSSGVLKIGFIDSLAVLYGTQEGQQEIARVEQFIEEKQKDYESRLEELGKQQQQFQAQQRTLNPQTQTEMQRKLENEDRALRRFQEDIQVEMNTRRDDLLGKVGEKIQGIINEYAQKQNFGTIFLRSEAQVYVAPSLDFTQEIIRLYNERYPVSEGNSASTGAP
ncbi:MAG: OmpH family outer membrane protein [Acidobacteria bacterium]|nr:OmpH family outer membrane protein [Acidobacteriota bacterium]